MADPLNLLREALLRNELPTEVDDLIVFGLHNAFRRDEATNFEVYGQKGKYYTLEALLFFARNKELAHPKYVQAATKKGIQVVTRADRKDVLDWLTRQDAKMPAAVNQSMNVTIPVKLTQEQLKKVEEKRHDEAEGAGTSAVAGRRKEPDGAAEGVDAKRARIELEPEADVKAPADDEAPSMSAVDETKKLEMTRAKERVWVTRNNIIQISTTKLQRNKKKAATKVSDNIKVDVITTAKPRTLYESTLARLKALKERRDREEKMKREEAANQKAGAAAAVQGNSKSAQPSSQSQGYSRYEQEKFRSQKTEIAGFQINQNLSLLNHKVNIRDMMKNPELFLEQQNKESAPAQTASATNGVTAPTRSGRQSKTPIIIIPATPTSLITMYNVHSLLEELKYKTSDECKAAGVQMQSETLIKRPLGPPIHYRCVINPMKLTDEQWQRVVAVFVQGPAWQFKGWKLCNGDPTMLFQQVAGFHLKWNDAKTEKNVSSWNVRVLNLSRTAMHTHRVTLTQFWNELDKFVRNHPRLKTTVNHPGVVQSTPTPSSKTLQAVRAH